MTAGSWTPPAARSPRAKATSPSTGRRVSRGVRTHRSERGQISCRSMGPWWPRRPPGPQHLSLEPHVRGTVAHDERGGNAQQVELVAVDAGGRHGDDLALA